MDADDELRYGMSCRFLRPEATELAPGGRLVRTMVRADGLKHRHITVAFVLQREEAAFGGFVAVRCFDVACECSLAVRVRLLLLIGDAVLRSVPWLDEIEIRDDSGAVRFDDLLHLGDFEGTADDSVVTVKVLLDIKDASPAFLLPPRVPTFHWTSLCDEDHEVATLNCSDGSVSAAKVLLRHESHLWRSCLSEPGDAGPLDCADFSVAQMRAFVFFLQSKEFFDIARFDTLHQLVRIATRFAVSSVSRRCAVFVNECLQLEEAAAKAPEAASSASNAPVTVCSRVRWGVADLVGVWDTTVTHLAEEELGMALMRVISRSTYAHVASQSAFQKLSVSAKSTFYHQFLLCKEEAAQSGEAESGSNS